MNGSSEFAEYVSYSDEELIRLIHGGDEQAFGCLCSRYIPVCRSLAGRYAGPAIEPEDLAQEGMLGLIEATRRFDPQKQVPFHLYSKRCIVSKMFSALGAMNASKRRANVGSLPLDEQEGLTAQSAPLPEEVLIENEEMRHRGREITSLLSAFENEALRLYLRGCSYAQIAAHFGIPQKSVDNALQRVRRKLRAVWTQFR